jgi:hypothetical protein
MVSLSREQLQRLARLGAKARLEELRREELAIRRAFPELVAEKGGRGTTARRAARKTQKKGRRRSTMSAAARKAVSERMTKYWAKQRRAKASK